MAAKNAFKRKGLTTKQERFVEFFEGNATEAAIKAGYAPKSAHVTGSQLLRQPKIADAIRDRQEEKMRPEIATREERQELWTRIMRDEEAPLRDRLRASELLGKSEGDFLERVEVDAVISPAAILEKIRERRAVTGF